MKPVSQAIRVYALAVCFMCVTITIVSTAIALFDIIQLSFPKLTDSSYLMMVDTYEEQQNSPGALEIKKKIENGANIEDLPDAKFVLRPPPISNHVRFKGEALESLIFNSILIALCAIVFFLHWRIAKKSA